MGCRVLRHPIWGYAVRLCPIKETPGLNELTKIFQALEHCISSNFFLKEKLSYMFDCSNVTEAAIIDVCGLP